MTLYLCLCSIAVTVTALLPTRLCRIAVFLVKPTFSQILEVIIIIIAPSMSHRGIFDKTHLSLDGSLLLAAERILLAHAAAGWGAASVLEEAASDETGSGRSVCSSCLPSRSLRRASTPAPSPGGVQRRADRDGGK